MSKTKPHVVRRKKNRTYSAESLYRNIYQHLTLDLTAPGTRERSYGLSKIMDDHRASLPLSYWGATPHKVKVWRQLELFHKRLIFKTDTSFEQLSSMSLDEFVAFQQSSSIPAPCTKLLIERARSIVSDILGPFDFERYADSCQFAKKAALGLTRKQSYLDCKINALNGTQTQLNLFNAVRARDIHLLRATRRSIKTFKIVSSVKVTSVPKSYKAARIIAPDTVVGGFLSRGLGLYIRDRVEACTHIKLAKQQHRHKEWAKQGSLRGHLATLDMSKASDSFMPGLLRQLLPKDWAGMVEAMRTERYETSHGVTGYLASSMLMGSGHTFPLQTLLFYAITLAVCELIKERGLVSVYGDDIILPNFATPSVLKAFGLLGFSVNTDKSFWSSDYLHVTKFRESCGGDFYNGVAVRPWMPECEATGMSKNTYIAELHKAINGLCAVWHPVEITETLRMLLNTLADVCDPCFVPDTESETAGVRCGILLWLDRACLADVFHKARFPVFSEGVVHYTALRPKVRNRLSDGRGHYWAWFQSKAGIHFVADPNTEREPPQETVGTHFRREPKRGEKVTYRWTQ